jgi:hypothetical protein
VESATKGLLLKLSVLLLALVTLVFIQVEGEFARVSLNIQYEAPACIDTCSFHTSSQDSVILFKKPAVQFSAMLQLLRRSLTFRDRVVSIDHDDDPDFKLPKMASLVIILVYNTMLQVSSQSLALVLELY